MNLHAPEFHARNKCPLCHAGELPDHLVLDHIRIASCRACGFMFSRDTLPSLDIDQFYIDGYHDQRHMDGQRVNATTNVELLHYFCPDLARRSLLDIGSGYGFLLDKIRSGGADRVAGVELSNAQRDYSIRKLKLETHGQIDDLSPDDKFDVVTAFEVIEHIPAPREFIVRACEHLKVGGSLIIGTDNFASDVVNALGRQFPKWIPHEHVSFFTSTTLKQMLEGCGTLKLAGVRSYTPWELLLRQFVFRATSGRRGGKTYSYETERSADNGRGYRYFSVRLTINRVWFKIANRANLDGEMMYIHMIKH